jgi:hypothetical protein
MDAGMTATAATEREEVKERRRREREKGRREKGVDGGLLGGHWCRERMAGKKRVRAESMTRSDGGMVKYEEDRTENRGERGVVTCSALSSCHPSPPMFTDVVERLISSSSSSDEPIRDCESCCAT